MTSQLVKLYDNALKLGDDRNFEIILVGYDKDGKAHEKYMKKSKIAFAGLKMDKKEAVTAVTDIGAEEWIPNIALVSKDGKLISNDQDKVFAKLTAMSTPKVAE